MNDRQKEILQAQLNREKRTIAELKQVYKQASKDCEDKIRQLSARDDMENLQSIIYQKQYQEVLKKQIDNVLEQLQTNEFTTIEDYLVNCYSDGYLGVMYDIAGQGIPVIMPMDQEQVVKAIQTDSKLSTNLYTRLGEDVKTLKTSIRAELSRGIANGSTWNQIASKVAKRMNSDYNKAYNNAIRIARTEGHRIQCQSAYDAQKKAKSKGADIVKQWDATLDGKTRDSHRKVDGEIRELDEPFSNGLMKPGDSGAPASEVVNCRCALLQRARWALDEDELKTLENRADYYGLDKSKEFDDFKEKYLIASKFENGKSDLLFQNMPNSTMTAQQKFESMMEVSKAYSELPVKVKQTLPDVTFEFGHSGNSCEIAKKKINVAIGTTKEDINHEYGHLIEGFMMNKADVDAYKTSLTKGMTYANIKKVTYFDNAKNPHDIFVLKGGNFETEYQSRLYVNNLTDALNADGSINIECLGECISEPFRKYMNGEPISSDAKKLIEGAVL